eukprot:130554_1
MAASKSDDSKGILCDLNGQKKKFQSLDGDTTVESLLKRLAIEADSRFYEEDGVELSDVKPSSTIRQFYNVSDGYYNVFIKTTTPNAPDAVDMDNLNRNAVDVSDVKKPLPETFDPNDTDDTKLPDDVPKTGVDVSTPLSMDMKKKNLRSLRVSGYCMGVHLELMKPFRLKLGLYSS